MGWDGGVFHSVAHLKKINAYPPPLSHQIKLKVEDEEEDEDED